MNAIKYMRATIAIVRPVNVVMASLTAGFGFLITGGKLFAGLHTIGLLLIATGASVAFGNIINDIFDLNADRINRPKRPLPSNAISVRGAQALMIIMALTAIISGFAISPVHGIGVIIPLVLLSSYAMYAKRTPLLGNILVSVLVGYPLVFGGLTSPLWNVSLAAAALAFCVNLDREIIKAVEDIAGDTAAGYKTTAHLPDPIIKLILMIIALIYGILLPQPYLHKLFGNIYLIGCCGVVFTLHLIRLWMIFQINWKKHLRLFSISLKIELLLGLAIIGVDRFLF